MLLNKIWHQQSLLTNCFYPQQKLVSKVRTSAKVSKEYDIATTPHRRAEAAATATRTGKTHMGKIYARTNPAAVQRPVQALTTELLALGSR